jgi:hypothetical protein
MSDKTTSPAPVQSLVGLRPYYDEAGITIYHADCAQVLPFLEPVDLLLTDPPYGIGISGHKKSVSKGVSVRKHHENLNWDIDAPSKELLDGYMAICRNSIIWGGNYMALPHGHKGWLVWDKAQRGLSMSDGELAWSNIPTVMRIYTCHRSHLWREGTQHPTQKPLELIHWCIQQADAVAPVSTILDPFMGSGTTLVAAKNLGKRAIGIERELKYCEIAVRRLAQQTLFQVEQSNSALDRPERPNAGNADQAAVVGGSASSDLLDADDQPEKIP